MDNLDPLFVIFASRNDSYTSEWISEWSESVLLAPVSIVSAHLDTNIPALGPRKRDFALQLLRTGERTMREDRGEKPKIHAAFQPPARSPCYSEPSVAHTPIQFHDPVRQDFPLEGVGLTVGPFR